MRAKETNFLKLMESQFNQYIVPIYQRTYSWGEKQCQVLWEDIIKISKKKKSDRHFIGSTVCYKTDEIDLPGQIKKEIIIDGQQRITTLSLLMIAIARTYEKIRQENVATVIRKNYLINEDGKDKEKYKLLPTNQDKETYLALIDGTENELKNPSKPVLDAFNLFMSLLDNDIEALQNAYVGLQKLDLVYIGLSSESDNPQLIFESMNSTGLKLTQGDLLRNYLLLDLDFEEQEELYKKYWRPIELDFGVEAYKEKFDYFLRDYLTMKERRTTIRLDSSYDEFKAYHEESKKTKEEALADLRKFAKYYAKIYKCNDEDEELNELWKELKIQRVEVANPFLIQVYNDYENTKEDNSINLSKNDFIDIVKAINSYVYRRYVCNIPTNSLNKTFALLGDNIEKENYKESVFAALLLMEDYKEFPSNEEFEKAFIKKDVYTGRLRNYTLVNLENYSHEKDKMSFENKDVTIEHVLPENKNLKPYWRNALGENWQELQREYVHTIGNLTFSNRAYNSEMQDYSFEDKMQVKGGIKYSNYRLSDDIAKSFKWDIDEIISRSKRLAKDALDIWKRPELSNDIMKKYRNNIKAEKNQYENMEHYPEMKKEIKEKYEELDKRILELDENIQRVYTKHYVAYKFDYSNFVEIIIYKWSINVLLDVSFDNIIDERELCEDISNIGSWGTGDVQIKVRNDADIDYIIGLIKQSLDNVKRGE